MNIDQYLDHARERTSATSDRHLARMIGIAGPSLNHYRTKKAWPDDFTMATIADMAGIDREIALLDLNSWRAKSPEIQSLYRAMAEKATAAVLLVFLLLPALGAKGTNAAQVAIDGSKTIHYATLWIALSAWLRGFFGEQRPAVA